jgi:TrmH family RNA methyltransferase
MSTPKPSKLTSLQNPRVKDVVRLQKRPHRDEQGLLLVEGYRELKRMLDNGRQPLAVFFAPTYLQGGNEPALHGAMRGRGRGDVRMHR